MFARAFLIDLKIGSRQQRVIWLRRLFSGWLILQLLYLYLSYFSERETSLVFRGRSEQALEGRFITSYLDVFVLQYFVLLLLVTPTFVAGSITDEKTRGTLEQLLSADLNSWEIVAGKLLSRLGQIALLGLVSLPLLCWMGGLAHFGLGQLAALVAASAAPLFALGAASILASVWSRQTSQAVLRVYFLGSVAVLLWLVAGHDRGPALACLNPLYVLGPVWIDADFATYLGRLLLSALLLGAFGFSCLSVAAWRLRPAYRRQLERLTTPSPSNATTHRPVRNDPIVWKELNFERSSSFSMLRHVPRAAGVLLAALAAIVLYGGHLSAWPGPSVYLGGGAALLLFSLAVGIRASAAIVSERERHTWEPILLTPLETDELVDDKLWGVLLSVLPAYVGFAVPAFALALFCGPEVTLWTVFLLPVMAAFMYFLGTIGIYCSVCSESSWQSLLATLAIGYGHSFVLLAVLVVLTFCSFGLLAPVALWFFVRAARSYRTIAAQFLERWERTGYARGTTLSRAALEVLRRERAENLRGAPAP